MKSVDLSVTTEIVINSLKGGARPFLTVTSESMTPLIRAGDEIQVTLTNQQELEVGDIIIVGDADGFLAHRFWSTLSVDGSKYLLLRGDRLKYFDPPYPATKLVGRAISRRRDNVTLDLTQGIGRRLDLIVRNMAALAVPPPATQSLESVPGLIYTNPEPGMSIRVARRPMYGGLYYSAKTITVVIDILNRFQHRFGRR